MSNTAFKSTFTLPTLDPGQIPVAMLETLCPSDRPLVLLPVRLETRFFPQADGGRELRVRVYPDKVHVDSHETELTPAEREWGVHFWEQDWRASTDAQRRAAAWRQLADRYGAERAAWIVRLLRPVNPQSRPATPLPADAPLPAQPQFRDVAVSADEASWRRAPRAELLPDRWVAVVQSGGRPVLVTTGLEIARPLAVGPDPNTPPAEVPGDQLAIDQGMKWMIDFDEAEARGMALRLAIPPFMLEIGLDSLFVFGATSMAPEEASNAIAKSLDAHHYTDGLEFLRPGAASNNTADQRAGYGSEDAGHERSFATEVILDPLSLSAASNAARLGGALGLPPEEIALVIGRAANGAQQHDRDARSMNTALWQAGWGYFLSNMVGMEGTGLTLDHLTWARDRFVSDVRAAGPYPALRCGRQPYGLLPVTSLDLWKPRAGEEGASAQDLWLRDLLLKLRDLVWRPRLPEAPRVGKRQNPLNPDADLADVMQLEGASTVYRVRTMLGRHYHQHLRAFIGEDLQASGFLRAGDELTGGILERLGITWRPRVAQGIYAGLAFRLRVPLVQAGEVSAWRTLDPDYIGALLAETRIAALIAARPDPEAPAGWSLLRLLLRHALLREYAHAAALIASAAPGADLQRLLREEELVDLPPEAGTLTAWMRQLDSVVPAVTGAKTVRQFLEELTTFDLPSVKALGEVRRSLAHLQQLDSEVLQVLMQGTLDLSAYRLDAWITSFATRRLAESRASAPLGVRVGGYGWVENLFPAAVPGVEVPPPRGEEGPLVAAAGDTGFIHAPSLTHAATAALLRNAHLGNSEAASPESPFAIDLSSRRVRAAAWLLDGMRQEQPLGALLGYRLERRLHDLAMDHLTKPVRELAPLTARKLETSALPLETIAANNVVDGEALFRMWDENAGQVKARLQQAGASDNDLANIDREIAAIGDAIDAVSDALTAEAAYQMVRGNTSRTASTLKAIAEGDAPPPELEVARTPRTGIAVTHRVMVLFGGTPSPTPGWTGPDRSPRAAAEPVLNAWAARLLGDARKVRCTAEHLDPTTGAVLAVRAIPLSDLGLAPLDVVYGVGRTGSPADEATSDLEERVQFAVRRGPQGLGSEPRLRLQHARPSDLGADEITLFEAIEQARAVRALFESARPAHPDDLVPPERPNHGLADLADVESRVVKAEDALRAAHQTLDTVAHAIPGDAEDLRGALLAMGGFGIDRTAPTVAVGNDAIATSALLRQARAVLGESKRRVNRVAELRAAALADDPRRRQDALLERLRAVFGAGFLVLPRFTSDEAASLDLKNALAASASLQDGDPLAVHTWFVRAERVRDNLARFATPLRGAEILGTGERLDLRVAQLPFAAGERWIGLPVAPGKDPQAGKLSLAIQAQASLDAAGPMTGLWLDEWIEVIPSREETTGIAFQYNPPDACAPQTILIAVPPDLAEPWTVAGLYRVLAETLDLAKLRAVDLESLSEVAQYLPAAFFAFNAQDEVVSTDFWPLADRQPG